MSTDGQDKAVNGEDGDKAFWQQCSAEANGNHSIHYGLTKREHFAGLAMQGILSNADATVHLRNTAPKTVPLVDIVAELAVEHADALLAALEARHDD